MAIVTPIAQRRPWANRSRNGPISGATMANGSIVRPRKSATWPRASPVGTWKNSVPASEIATAASPAALKACSSISRESPDWPAPSASAPRRAWRSVARPSRPVTRAAPATPRPATFAPLPTTRPACLARSRPDGSAGWCPGWLVGHCPILPRTVHADGARADQPHPRPDSACPMSDNRPVTLTSVASTARAKSDATVVGAVDRARAALLEEVDAGDVGDHLGALVEGDRVATHLFALRAPGLPRLALVGDRRPGLAAEGRHGRRDRADPRRRGDRRPRRGCPTRSASSPATSPRATCSRSRRTTSGWCRRTPSARTRASTPDDVAQVHVRGA